MATRNIYKQLAGMEDLLTGKGTVSQSRGGSAVTISRVDVPFAVESKEALQALDVNLYTHARLYGTDGEYVEYIFDPNATTGISSGVGPGRWVIKTSSVLHFEFATFSALATGNSLQGKLQPEDVARLYAKGLRVRTIVNNTTSNAGGASYKILTTAEKDASEYNGTEGYACIEINGSGYWGCLRVGDSIEISKLGAQGDATGTVGVGTDTSSIFSAAAALCYETVVDLDCRISTPVIYSESQQVRLTLKNKTVWIDEGVKAFRFKANGCGIYGDGFIKYLKSSDTSFNVNSVAVHVERDSIANFVRSFSIVGDNALEIHGATESLRMNTIFWIKLENLETYKDKYGFRLNKQNPDPNKATTTLTMRRVYFHGGNGSKLTGTQAYDCRYVTDFDCYKCVAEWYPWLGEMREIQSGTVIGHYYEYCDAGMDYHTITGNLTNIDSYANGIPSGGYAYQALYGTITNIGGRGVLDSGSEYAKKGTSGNVIHLRSPSVTGGGTSGVENSDTLLTPSRVQSNFRQLNNSEFEVPLESYFVIGTTKKFSITVTHGAATSWRPWMVKVDLAYCEEDGGTADKQSSIIHARKLDTSIVTGSQQTWTTKTDLFVISFTHDSATQTTIDIDVTSPDVNWGCVGKASVFSGNGFTTVSLS